MGIPQFTTPTFLLTFDEPGLNLTKANNVYVTFQSGRYKLTKTGASLDVGENTIGVHLTQEDTGNFYVGDVNIQANWTMENGDRFASEIVNWPISDQLLRSVKE